MPYSLFISIDTTWRNSDNAMVQTCKMQTFSFPARMFLVRNKSPRVCFVLPVIVTLLSQSKNHISKTYF